MSQKSLIPNNSSTYIKTNPNQSIEDINRQESVKNSKEKGWKKHIGINTSKTLKHSQFPQIKIPSPKKYQQQNSQISPPSYSGVRDKSQIFEKLKKRTLRSKVSKLLDDFLNSNCGKIVDFCERNQELTQFEKKFKVQEYKEMIKSENFKKKKFNLSKYDRNEFVYSLPQTKYQKSLDESIISKPLMQIEGPIYNQFQEAQQTILEVCQHLKVHEILEIGEDPTYFIVKESHKRNKELLDPQNWTEIGMMIKNSKQSLQSLVKKTIQNNNKKLQRNQSQSNMMLQLQGSFMSQQQNQSLQNTPQNNKQMNSKRQYKYISDSLDFDPHQSSLFSQPNREPKQEIFNYEGIERKKNILRRQQEDLINIHRNRYERWQYGNEEQEIQYENNRIRMIDRYLVKQQQAEKQIQERNDKIQQLKEEKHEQERQQYEFLQQNRQDISEDDEIFVLQQNLRSLCLNEKVKKLQEEENLNKKKKIENLRKFNEKVATNRTQLKSIQQQYQKKLKQKLIAGSQNSDFSQTNHNFQTTYTQLPSDTKR